MGVHESEIERRGQNCRVFITINVSGVKNVTQSTHNTIHDVVNFDRACLCFSFQKKNITFFSKEREGEGENKDQCRRNKAIDEDAKMVLFIV